MSIFIAGCIKFNNVPKLLIDVVVKHVMKIKTKLMCQNFSIDSNPVYVFFTHSTNTDVCAIHSGVRGYITLHI